MPNPNPESRVFERRSVMVITTAKPNFGGQSSSVTVKNLSRGGIALLATKPFDVGATLVVDIRGNIKMVSVAHVRQEGLKWHLGCRFLGRLTDAEFAALLGPEDNLRRVDREQLTVVTSCKANAGETSLTAKIRNISPEGVGLLAEKPLEAGETVVINMGGVAKVGLVTFAKQEEGQEEWLIGCRFVGPLTPEELASVLAGGDS